MKEKILAYLYCITIIGCGIVEYFTQKTINVHNIWYIIRTFVAIAYPVRLLLLIDKEKYPEEFYTLVGWVGLGWMGGTLLGVGLSMFGVFDPWLPPIEQEKGHAFQDLLKANLENLEPPKTDEEIFQENKRLWVRRLLIFFGIYFILTGVGTR
jgi:hypothetical protein